MSAAVDAHILHWDGCVNVRDLGGYLTAGGARTTVGAVIRSDNPAYLTDRGWAALCAYGVRTVIALRTIGAGDDEPAENAIPSTITLVRVAIEDVTDREFYEHRVANGLWGTPLYFSDAITRWPGRAVAAVRAVAHAPPGGVVISCGRGCDRTGLLALLLLRLVGVPSPGIAADYALSMQQMPARDPTYPDTMRNALARHRTTMEQAITAVASGPIVPTLRGAGLADADLAALRARLVGA